MSAIQAKPVVCVFVVDMGGIEDRDQEIHIEKDRDLFLVSQSVYQAHTWSSNTSPRRDQHYPVAYALRGLGRERFARQVRDDLPER
jgi:hypothetical protein